WFSEDDCEGFNWDALGNIIWGTMTTAIFENTKNATLVGLWMVEQTYSFNLVRWMDQPAERLTTRMTRTFVAGGRLDLRSFVVFLAVVYTAYQLYRRRVGHGISELIISLIIAVAGAGAVAYPGWLLDTGLDFSIGVSAA